MARLFLAVWPPQAVVRRLAELSPPDVPQRPGVRWLAPHDWHVTLRFLGDADPADVAAALDGVELPAADAVLGPEVRRLGAGVVMVPVAGLEQLAAVVVSATSTVGEPPDPRPFNGHVTLARLRHGARCDVVGAPFTTVMHVAEVVLASSETTPRGATYRMVGRWATTPRLR